jgi:molybdopterin-guanine dinucleotide biosynthesis protein A
MPPRSRTGVAGVLLAGGRSGRMGGGDKCLRTLGGTTLLARAIARARPQVDTLMLNANGDPARFESYGLPVAPDVIEGFAGPLAGVLTGMEWARANAPGCAWIATFATDAPFFPTDLVARLVAAVEAKDRKLACAASRGRAHPVFGLWPVDLAGALRVAVLGEEIRKIDRWTARYRLAEVAFADDPVDPFFNVNVPEDLAEAERLSA